MTQHYLHVQENVRLAAVERFGNVSARGSVPDGNSNIMELTGFTADQMDIDDAEVDLFPNNSHTTKKGTIIRFPK